jgi:hypothetical protein
VKIQCLRKNNQPLHMINFFRKTSKKLADDNKPLKYIRFAIGEIVLVVVGILIALSINNWNETQKYNKEETTILENLHENLKQAKTQSTDFIHNKEQKKELLISALGISSNRKQNDTISISDLDFYDLLCNLQSQVPVINTYSDIKSTDKLSIIKNREIRESFNGLELAINDLNAFVSDRLTVQQLRIDEIAVNEINFIPLLKRQTSLDITNEIPNNSSISRLQSSIVCKYSFKVVLIVKAFS